MVNFLACMTSKILDPFLLKVQKNVHANVDDLLQGNLITTPTGGNFTREEAQETRR